MKKQIITFAMTAVCGMATAQTTGSLNLSIDDKKLDSVVVIIQNVSGFRTEKMETVALKKGKLTYPFPYDTPRMTIIAPKAIDGQGIVDQSRMIYFNALPATEIKITGSWNDIHISGAPFYDADRAFDESNKELFEQYKAGMAESEKMQKEGAPLDTVMAVYNEKALPAKQEMEKRSLAYVKAHPDEDLSASIAAYLEGELFDEAVAALSDRARGGMFKGRLDAIIDMRNSQKQREEASRKVAEAEHAPDFTLNDLNGNPLTLSSLRGKYVVLDFWGSWCGWCIKGVPDMKKYYDKYKDRMEILGVACNDKEDKWRNAVEKNEMNWLHVFNTKESDVTVAYGIQGYPTKIVISPEGKVLKTVVGESPEFYEYLDELFKE